MATNIENNLFPPIFTQSYIPAFIYTSKCRIYFSLSVYNTLADLHIDYPVQVIVQNQLTNQYALDSSKYPSGIMLTSLNQDETRQQDDKYYIEINSSDIQNGFNLNQYYKVQIRFTAAAASMPPSTGIGIDGWLAANINYFSQWSSVVLIYGISQPILTLNNFTSQVATNKFSSFDVPITGKITFNNELDSEILKSYHIYLYNKSNELLQDSDEIYLDSYQSVNEINYYFRYDLQINTQYTLKIQITTKNLYSWSTPKSYKFLIQDNKQPQLDVDVELTSNDELGYVRLYMKNKYFEEQSKKYVYRQGTTVIGKSLYLTLSAADLDSSESALYIPDENIVNQSTDNEENQEETQQQQQQKPNDTGDFRSALYFPNDNDDDTQDDDETMLLYSKQNMYHDLAIGSKFMIKRSSSRDNFKKWDHIDTITIKQNNVSDLTWYDYTVEPGIWYKYYIIKCINTGLRVSSLKLEDKIMTVPEDIFLDADGKQLRIRYNPVVDNFSIKVSENLIETIGSKYPYVKRNGNIGYKTFSLSGTITAFMDLKENLLQASKSQVYGESADLYKQYNQQHNITLYNDYIYERQFRRKVMDFLYANDVKLFRSLTQGNILVKLMNITFTPNVSLGRLIYNFSCTAYEIDECNFDSYQKYGIMIGKYRYN